MRLFLTNIFLFLNILASYPQSDCIVKYNSGKVQVKGKLLKKYDIFKYSDTIVFTNPKGVLKFCHTNCRVDEIILGENLKTIKANSLQDYNNYRVKLTTRNDFTLTTKNINKILPDNLGVIDTLKILISEKYKVDKNNVFLISFRVKGKEINKKIKVKNNQLLIYKHLTKVNNKDMNIDNDSSITLLHYNILTNQNNYLIKDVNIKYISKSSIYRNLNSVLEDKLLTTNEKAKIISEYLKIKYPSVMFFKQNISNML